MMQTAYAFSRIMSWFPFVRCVCLSGSISKGYMDESGDIDYFIITKPGRLWIARTLLITFKKVALLNSRKYFCVNYFIDTNHLEIPDKNLFTATELLTLVPVYNHILFQDLLHKNTWAREFLPNHAPVPFELQLPEKHYPIKRFVEWILDNRFGEMLDTWFMKLTLRRWQRRFSGFSPETMDLAMRTRKYVSKHHPQNFQRRVLKNLEERIREFERTHQIQLNFDHG